MELAAVMDILGGKQTLHKEIKNRMDLIELSKKGVTKEALAHLARYLNFSMGQMAQVLPVTERTLQRYGSKKRFNPVVSEQILQIAEVIVRGSEVFGDKNRFLEWLKLPNKIFKDKTPGSLLGSKFGAEMILEELGRIEYGIIS